MTALLPGLVLIGALAWPLLFAGGGFYGDGPNHAWLIWHQSVSISELHRPSFFLNYFNGEYDRVFYPEYAFYGGTIYALAGMLSLLLGKAPVDAYILTYFLGFAATCGGWYWMGRMAGLGRWAAHAPGAVFVSSAYYLTLIYGRGDWPEFIGVAMIPLMTAAGLSVLRSRRLQIWPCVALVASGVVFFGSHTLTVLWGSTILVLTGIAIVVCIPQARTQITRPGAIRLTGLIVVAMLVSAWFLLPALANEASTFISKEYGWARQLRGTDSYVSLSRLFTLSRVSDTEPGALFALSLPVAAMAWVLGGTAIALPAFRKGPWLRLTLIMIALVVVIVFLLRSPGVILALPTPYTRLQFTYRLESYLMLGVSGGVLALLVLFKQRTVWRRRWLWTIYPVLLVSLVGAMQQAHASALGKNLGAPKSYSTAPYTKAEFADYVDATLPFITQTNLPKLHFSPASVRDEKASLPTHLSSGQLASTNIESWPSLLHVEGARIVGVDPEGDDVLQIGADERVSLSAADSFPVVAGGLLSLLGVIALVLALVAALVAGRVHRRRELDAAAAGAGG